MKKTCTIIFLFVSGIVSISCKSQNTPVPQSLPEIIVQEGLKQNFSGTVLVARRDSIILIKSVGYANREQNIVNDTTTRFNIASTGKLFTRIVILQLVQEGKINLDDKIVRFYHGFNQPEANQITIYHLLDHKSGLGDIMNSTEYLKPENISSTENVVKLIAQENPEFSPGSKDKYSNSGYYLLGAIIEKVTGKPFADAIKERIFDRLEMKNSGFGKTGDVIPNHALPYKKTGDRIIRAANNIIGEPPSGAGGEYTTAPDMFKVFQSIINDEMLLNNNSKAALFNHFQPGNWDEIIKSDKLTGYVGGDTRGWSAKLTFMFNKGRPYGVVILSNFDNMAHELDLKLRDIIIKL